MLFCLLGIFEVVLHAERSLDCHFGQGALHKSLICLDAFFHSSYKIIQYVNRIELVANGHESWVFRSYF